MPNNKEMEDGLNTSKMILTYVVVLIWILFFVAGILVNSAPYREVIANQPVNPGSIAVNQVVFAWFIVMLCYTPTNILFLAMTAGLLGALSRIAKLHVKDTEDTAYKEIPSDTTNPLLSGLLRGVFVYLLLVSGVLVINESPFISPTQIQYLRLAGVLSLLSFLLSYDPTKFRSFLAKGYGKLETLPRKNGSKT